MTLIYIITERDSGRYIQTLTPTMVTSLVDAGWIEREPGQSRATYRVTQAGVVAANLPRHGREMGN